MSTDRCASGESPQTAPAQVGPPQPEVRFVPMGAIKVYMVTDGQLRQLELGSPSSALLTLGIASATTFVSLFAGLLVAEFPPNLKAYTVFVLLTIVSGLSTIVLLVMWCVLRRRSRSLADEIRSLEPEPPPISRCSSGRDK